MVELVCGWVFGCGRRRGYSLRPRAASCQGEIYTSALAWCGAPGDVRPLLSEKGVKLAVLVEPNVSVSRPSGPGTARVCQYTWVQRLTPTLKPY